jgi:CMP-N,N'-diacetyllegionaminic acid synthase
LVPARAGSKAIKNKNIVDFNGKPLLHWTLDIASQLCPQQTILSSDCENIIQTGNEHGSDIKYHIRSEFSSSDEAPTINVVQELVNQMYLQMDSILVLLEPTSPLRSSNTINNAIKYFQTKKLSSLVSVTHFDELTLDSLKKKLIINENAQTLRRQDRKNTVKINGNFYINKVSSILENGFLHADTYTYIVDKYEGMEINDIDDLEILRLVAKGYYK